MKRIWLLFLARFRLSKKAICAMSVGRGEYDDFHDYPDSTIPEPWHFYLHKCCRCGKEFRI